MLSLHPKEAGDEEHAGREGGGARVDVVDLEVVVELVLVVLALVVLVDDVGLVVLVEVEDEAAVDVDAEVVDVVLVVVLDGGLKNLIVMTLDCRVPKLAYRLTVPGDDAVM